MPLLARALSAALALGAALGLVAAPGAPPTPEAEPPVVIVGVGGLDWDDVDRQATPTLWRLVATGAVGSLSARTNRPEACAIEAWATVGAGRRVQVPTDPAGEEECAPVPTVTPPADRTVPGPATVTGWSELLAALPPETPQPQLGTRIAAAGSCAVAVGPGAALALADATGHVARYTDTLSAAAFACPVTVVDAGDLTSEPSLRQDELAALDAHLAEILDLRPPGTQVLVAGLYESPAAARGLQAVVRSPTTVGWLSSESTRYPGVVTISDLTATALATAGAEAADLDGAALTVAGERRMSAERTVDNRRYLTAMSATIPVMLPVLLAVFALAGLAAAVALLRGRRRPGGPGPATRRVVTAVFVACGALPAGTYLAALSRWWVAPAPAVAAAVTAVGAVTGVALVAWAVSRRLPAGPWRVGGALAAVNWLVLTLDALTGTTLQQGSLLGQIPTLGTRFHGFGNVAFSVYAVSALVLAGALAAAARARGRQRVAAGIVLALGAVTVLVDGWPGLGADFGGVLALVPAFAVLLAHVTGRPWSGRRVATVTALTVLAVTLAAVVDWARPGPGTHLGRFVQRIIDGEAWPVVLGKAEQVLATVIHPGGAVLTLLVGAGILALVGPCRPAAVRAASERWPLLAAVCRAIAVAAVLGTVLNDSGILVGAGVMGLATALLGASAVGAAWYGPTRGPVPATGPVRAAAPGPLPRALVAVGGGLLAAMLLGAAAVPSATAGAVTAGGDPAVTGRVVVVGTTGVTWDDVTATATPALWSLVRDGAAVGGVTPAVTDAGRRCASAGWLALSAGRTVVAGQAGPGGWTCVPWTVSPGGPEGGGVVVGWAGLVGAQAASEFRPRPGALGAALAEAGVCAVAVGPGAGMALATPDGAIDRYLDLETALADPAAAFACPVTLVDVRPAITVVPMGDAESLRLQDRALHQVLAAVPADATVLVTDTGSASTDRPALGVGAVTGGADAAAGHLTAGSTRWAGVVRLLDVPTTVLAAVGVTEPGDFAGSPILATGSRPALATVAVEQLADLTARDQALRGVGGTVTSGVLLAGLLALALVVLGGPGDPAARDLAAGPAGRAPRALARVRSAVPLRAVGEALALVLAAVPAGLFLMTTWEWWRFPAGAMWAALALATATVAGGLALVARAPGRLGPVVASAVVGAVLTLDAVLGTPLHRGSPLGPAVTLGGRFYGFGNPTYAVYVVAMVVLAAGVATALVRAGRRGWALAATAGIGVVALVVDLWPTLGADVGGGLVLVPVFAILVLAVAGIRVTLPRLALIGAAGVLAVGAIGLLDWLRPAAERSHLGRFVQSVIDGTAWETVARKAGYALESLTGGPMVWLATALMVALVLVLWQRVPWRVPWLESAEADFPLLRPVLWALVVAAVGGALVNDYGLRIVTLMAFTLVPLLALLVARTAPTPAAGGPLPCEQPIEGSTP